MKGTFVHQMSCTREYHFTLHLKNNLHFALKKQLVLKELFAKIEHYALTDKLEIPVNLLKKFHLFVRTLVQLPFQMKALLL